MEESDNVPFQGSMHFILEGFASKCMHFGIQALKTDRKLIHGIISQRGASFDGLETMDQNDTKIIIFLKKQVIYKLMGEKI